MKISRRHLLKLCAGTATAHLAGIRPASVLAGQPMKTIPIGLQLYSIREIASKDPQGAFAAVAEMGYQGVEFAGYYGRKAENLRAMLDRNGLKCCGTHIKLDALCAEALKDTVEFNKTLGNQFLIVSSLPPTSMGSMEGLIEAANLLTQVAENVRSKGMRVGYHAHPRDFKPVARQIPWEIFFNNAGPNVVMQLDTGNCLAGSGDPIAMLKKFPHRSATIHLKEYGGLKGAVIGEGDVAWRQVFELCQTIGDTEWYIVEQETYRTSPLESVRLCLKNLRKMGK